MKFRHLAATAAMLAGIALAPVHAALLFSDSFDADNGSSVLNFNGLINWTVSGGTIDYIRSGNFGISCVGGVGGCLDMDGSSSNAGRITSKQLYDFDDGVQYFIDLALSGNQRGGNSDSVLVGLVRESDGALLGTELGPFAPNAPFGVFTANFFGENAPGSWRLYVEGVGGDNIGAILDNYALRDDRVAPVPEPATLVLTGIALLAAGAARRRRR